MAKVTLWECDWCEAKVEGEDITMCHVCQRDICYDCKTEHAIAHYENGVDLT